MPVRTHPIIEAFPLGEFQTNCYLVRPTENPDGSCWIADVGFDPEPLLDRVAQLGLTPEVIVLTHAHCDHIAGLLEARRRFPECPIWIHPLEAGWLSDPMLNLSAAMGLAITGPEPDRLINPGETLTLCGQPWRVLHTPGHSPGSITLVHDASNSALVGDALFAGSIGRTDFPGSSFDTLEESIRTQLYTLPDDTAVLPGHGPATTIGREKATNPFVQPA